MKRTLAALAEAGPITTADLAARLDLARSTVTGYLWQLKRQDRATYRRTGGVASLWSVSR